MEIKTEQIDMEGIKFLYDPGSIAIIGASADINKPSGRPLAALLRRGYRGKIYPVNPRYNEIGGINCYPSLLDIPGEIDLVIIGVPANLVLDIIGQCAQKKVKAAIIFSSGFAEVGPEGLALQREIAGIAKKNNMRICGPNCFGLINTKKSVMASFAEIVELEPISPGTLGFVTQSGAFGAIVYIQATLNGIGFSSFVSVGNEADLEFADFISYLLDDRETEVIGGYLEGAKNGAKLREAAKKALRTRKPILVIKVGRSMAGSRAASSHTGSLAGDDKVYDAFFRQMGIIRIESINDLISFVAVYRGGHRPRGRNTAIVSASGGAGVLLADKCESLGLTVPELGEETRKKLEQYLPFFGSARNPVDLTAQASTDPSLLGNCLRTLVNDPGIDMILVNTPLWDKTAPAMVKDLIEIHKSTDKPIVLASSILPGSKEGPRLFDLIKEANVPLLPDGLLAAQAMASLARYQEKAETWTDMHRPAKTKPDMNARELLLNPEPLSEFQCKQVLAAYGIPTAREGLAASAGEAVDLANRIGFPVVLKIQSPEIIHKTESGGVKTGLRSDDEVTTAYNEIMENARKHAPQARIDGVLVQEMLKGGIEVIVGSVEDPVFGHAVMFGLGGIFVEALKDVSFRIAPLSRQDAVEMIKEIKGHKVLEGLRGKPPVDLEALAGVILKVSDLVTEYGEYIKELDINPLFAYPDGVIAVDAAVIKK
jgi:acetyltransferase